MTRAALILALCGCAFSQKHPAITTAIVGGVVGGAACEIDNPGKQIYCAYATAGAAVFLGGIVALVYLFTNVDEHEMVIDDTDEAGAIHTSTPPPPGEQVDAGIDTAPVADAAPSD